VFDAQQF